MTTRDSGTCCSFVLNGNYFWLGLIFNQTSPIENVYCVPLVQRAPFNPSINLLSNFDSKENIHNNRRKYYSHTQIQLVHKCIMHNSQNGCSKRAVIYDLDKEILAYFIIRTYYGQTIHLQVIYSIQTHTQRWKSFIFILCSHTHTHWRLFCYCWPFFLANKTS